MHGFRYALLSTVLLLAGCAGMPMQPVASAPAKATPSNSHPTQPVLVKPAPAATAAVPASHMQHAAVAAAPTPSASTSAERPARRPARHPVAAHPPKTSREHIARQPSSTSTLDGRVFLAAEAGQRVGHSDYSNTLVYFVPASGNVLPAPGAFTVFTQNRAFDPAAIAIPLHSTVTFANLDEVRHNEFSVTPASAFDLGYQAAGQKTAHVFAHAGLVLVGCRVHRAMELDVLVVPTAFVTRAATDGRFSLHDLPPGPGDLYVWNSRGRLVTQHVTIPAAVDVRMAINRPALSTQLEVQVQP